MVCVCCRCRVSSRGTPGYTTVDMRPYFLDAARPLVPLVVLVSCISTSQAFCGTTIAWTGKQLSATGVRRTALKGLGRPITPSGRSPSVGRLAVRETDDFEYEGQIGGGRDENGDNGGRSGVFKGGIIVERGAPELRYMARIDIPVAIA